MNREIFNKTKVILTKLIKDNLAKIDISEQDRTSLSILLELLNQYSFENKLQQKGLLSHSIIDSSELDYSLGEKFIKFDNDIK